MITATRTHDREVIKGIMSLKGIRETIAEDGQDPDKFEPNLDTDCWLLISDDENVIGLYNLHAVNSVTLSIHAQVIPKFRGGKSRDTCKAVFRWLLEEAPGEYMKVIAEIPVIYQNVIDFSRSMGFSDEGINRMSYKKDGDIVDCQRMGITRLEIEGLLNE